MSSRWPSTAPRSPWQTPGLHDCVVRGEQLRGRVDGAAWALVQLHATVCKHVVEGTAALPPWSAFVHDAADSAVGRATYHTAQMLLQHLYGKRPAALQAALQAVRAGILHAAPEETLHFAFMLTWVLWQPGIMRLTLRQQRLRRQALGAARRAAAHLPGEQQHLLAAMHAADMLARGRTAAGLAACESALQALAADDTPALVGMLSEWVGRVLHTAGALTAAHSYLLQARQAFHGWGAHAKAAALDQAFPTVAPAAFDQERGANAAAVVEQLVRLERENAELQMAGGFAHEMRNALGAARYALEMVVSRDPDRIYSTLQGSTGLALQTLDESLAVSQTLDELRANVANVADMMRSDHDTALEIYGAISDGIERSVNITRRILEYAQVGRIVPRGGEVDLRDVVQRVLAEFSAGLTEAHVTLHAELPSTLRLPMQPEHAYTIVRNLVANARDALVARDMQRPGVLTVRGEREPRGVVLAVEDNGVGMPRAVQANVFKPFFTTKGSKGAGLSLGLSRKLAQVYGGELSFTSEEREGTTFLLVLPTAKASAQI